MTVMDSGTRTLTRTYETLYVGSEEWGQPPASQHVIEIRRDRGGEGKQQSESIYVTTGPVDSVADRDLEAEFAAWDMASDEALLSFEAGLD